MRISGYASRFDERDASGDKVRRGAFSASLLSHVKPIPMLSDHQRRIGVWDRAVEDQYGLYVEGRVSDPALQRLIRKGRVRGLSIGFRTRRAKVGSHPNLRSGLSSRDLLDLDLKEVSVVAFPMLRSARIDQISDDQISDNQITDDQTERTNNRRPA